MSIREQVLLDKHGNAVAVQVPITQYKRIMEQLEELEDIKAFDKALKRKHHFSPLKEAVQRLKAQRKRQK